MRVAKVVAEVGSGLNGHGLVAVPRSPGYGAIVGAPARLARFGPEQGEAALAAQGRRLVMVRLWSGERLGETGRGEAGISKHESRGVSSRAQGL